MRAGFVVMRSSFIGSRFNQMVVLSMYADPESDVAFLTLNGEGAIVQTHAH
jgi:hypothetical protein